jgi:hypothetical protein
MINGANEVLTISIESHKMQISLFLGLARKILFANIIYFLSTNQTAVEYKKPEYRFYRNNRIRDKVLNERKKAG